MADSSVLQYMPLPPIGCVTFLPYPYIITPSEAIWALHIVGLALNTRAYFRLAPHSQLGVDELQPTDV